MNTPTFGGILLEDVVRFVRKFVVLNDSQADAVALWIAHTHVIDAAHTTPYLAVTSALKRSGKSRLREVLGLVVREPLSASSISDAALFRAVEKYTPTLLLDEADAIFRAREREELRGMLNAGYRRGAVAYRMGGANRTRLETFPVFCAKAFFGIGDFLPDTLSDRALHVRLERRLRDESVERFREREAEAEGHELRDHLADWLGPQADDLYSARPDLPDELDDRAQDSWEPLLAIAELAAGDWPLRARAASLALSTGRNARTTPSRCNCSATCTRSSSRTATGSRPPTCSCTCASSRKAPGRITVASRSRLTASRSCSSPTGSRRCRSKSTARPSAATRPSSSPMPSLAY